MTVYSPYVFVWVIVEMASGREVAVGMIASIVDVVFVTRSMLES